MDMQTQIEIFLRIVFNADDIVEMRPLPSGKSEWCKANELITHIDKWTALNQRGENIYYGVLPRNKIGGAKAADVDFGRVIFCDFDKCTFDELKTQLLLLPPPTMIIKTSNNGFHCFWRLRKTATPAAIADRILAIAERCDKIDKAVRDPSRILRMPGFTNQKPDKKGEHCEIFEYNESRVYDLVDFALPIVTVAKVDAKKLPAQSPANNPQQMALTNPTNAIDRARAYIAKISGSDEGERNSQGYIVACRLVKDLALNESAAVELLREWNCKNRPPLDDHELLGLINHAQQYAKGEAGSKTTAQPADEESPKAKVQKWWVRMKNDFYHLPQIKALKSKDKIALALLPEVMLATVRYDGYLKLAENTPLNDFKTIGKIFGYTKNCIKKSFEFFEKLEIFEKIHTDKGEVFYFPYVAKNTVKNGKK